MLNFDDNDWLKITDNNFNCNLLYFQHEKNIEIEEEPIKNSYEEIDSNDPIEFLKLFITDEILEEIKDQTNIYASQIIIGPQTKYSLNQRLSEITLDEIKVYIGITLWMGIHSNAYYQDNWAKGDDLKSTQFNKFMSKNKFVIISKYFHLANNNEGNHNDPLKKVRPFVELCNTKWKEAYENPGKKLVIMKQ